MHRCFHPVIQLNIQKEGSGAARCWVLAYRCYDLRARIFQAILSLTWVIFEMISHEHKYEIQNFWIWNLNIGQVYMKNINCRNSGLANFRIFTSFCLRAPSMIMNPFFIRIFYVKKLNQIYSISYSEIDIDKNICVIQGS